MKSNKNPEETKALIESDEDFIVSTKYKNSIKNFLNHKPEGADNKTIAKFLKLEDPAEVEAIYGESVEYLKDLLDVEGEDEN